MNQKPKQICYKEFENPLFKEAANFASHGIKEQQKGNYDEAKKQIEEGLKALKLITINGKTEERKRAMDFHSLFQTFLKDVSSQEENEKIAMENKFTQSLILKDKLFITESENNFLSLLKQSKNINPINPEEIFSFTIKIFIFFSKAHDKGFFLTQNLFIRSEIFKQGNAKIPYLHQKYDVQDTINKNIGGFLNLIKQDAINGNNIEGLINYLIDVENWFSKEIKYILPCKYSKSNNDSNEKNRAMQLYKKFNGLKMEVENNDLNEKISSKADYIRIFTGVCNNFKEMKNILEPKYYKGEYLNNLNFKKKEICDIFYNTVIKWFLRDVLDLTKRFINKSLLKFENDIPHP